MKKFSWIFALLLALSIGFIGCPESAPPAKGGGNQGSTGGDDGFVPNPNVTAISVTFGTGDGQTPVKFAKVGDDGSDIAVGTVSYEADDDLAAGGYKYTYAASSVPDTNYGNAIGRFKVDLGEARLGDFGGVSFKWKGISGDVGGDNGSNITYAKNLFILASDTQDDLIPWKSDGDIRNVVVNTDYYTKEGNESKRLDAGDVDVPKVKGLVGYPANQMPDASVTEPYPIATPFKLNKELSGEVWFSIFFYAGNDGGSYSVSDFKFVPFAGFTQIDPPPPPVAEPPVPANIPDGFKKIELDLTVANCSDVSGYGDANTGINTLPVLSYADGALTAKFTKNLQRVNVKLSNTQKTTYNANPDATDRYIQIDCEIVGTDNESKFRYHVGIISTSSNFNETTGPGDFPLLKWKGDAGGIAVAPSTNKGIKLPKAVYGADVAVKPTADYFIFQYRDADIADGVTVKIKSITIWVPGKPKGPTVDLSSAIAASTIGKNNITVTDITGGVKIVTTQGYQWAWSYFKVTLPSGKTVADYETLSYTIKGITVTPALGDGSGYKGGYIYGFDTLTEIQDILDGKIGETSSGAGDGSQEMSSDSGKTTAIADLARAHLLATVGGSATGIAAMDVDSARNVKLNTKAAPNGQGTTSVGLTQTATEFYIIFSCGGSAGYTYELKDVKLVAGIED
jgi:hypothetical protein